MILRERRDRGVFDVGAVGGSSAFSERSLTDVELSMAVDAGTEDACFTGQW